MEELAKEYRRGKLTEPGLASESEEEEVAEMKKKEDE